MFTVTVVVPPVGVVDFRLPMASNAMAVVAGASVSVAPCAACVTVKVLSATPGALTVMVATRETTPVLLSHFTVKVLPLAPDAGATCAHDESLLDTDQLPTMLIKVTVSVVTVASFHV